jgi:nitroreductase
MALFLTIFICTPVMADTELPAPLTEGGSGVFSVLKNRASAPGGSYPTGQVSPEELSTLLWAATGLNRPKGWTVPMAMGREPYCKVYVAGGDGVFLYDWSRNALKEISKNDIRSSIGRQPFVANASHVLIFVIDGTAVDGFGDRGADWGYVAIGAMTQNVYLAAEALGIGARYMASLSADVAREALELGAKDIPACIMPIGKRAAK